MIGIKKIDYSLRLQLGLSLVAMGVPLGMYLNWFFPGLDASNITMFLSLFLITDWNRIASWRFDSYDNKLTYIVLFQFLMILYGIVNANNNNGLSLKYTLFLGYISTLCFSLMSVRERADVSSFLSTLFYSSLVLLFLGAYYTYTGQIAGDEVNRLKKEAEFYSLEPFTASFGTLTNMFAGLLLPKNTKLRKVLFLTSMVLGTYTILACGKRTPVVTFLAVIILVLWKKKWLSFRQLSNLAIKLPLTASVIISIYFINENFKELIDHFVTNTYNGFLVLLGDTSVSDATGSAAARTLARKYAFNLIETSFTPLNYLLGFGYMTRWIDAPLLQSYLDMGVLGFYSYLMIVIVWPIGILMRRTNDIVLLGISLSTYNIISCMNSGNEYLYIKYTAPCLLFFLYRNYLQTRKGVKSASNASYNEDSKQP